jgi:hypothetical protein
VSTPLTAADIDAKYQPTKSRAVICLDADVVLAIARLTEDMEREHSIDVNTNRVPVAPGIAEQILQLREQAKASEVEFVFHSIGRLAYTDLIRAHPATAEQQKDATDAELGKLAWNPDTFQPALFAASCESPTGTTAQWWLRKFDEWGIGQIQRLWRACLAAQMGVVELPKAEDASGLMGVSEPS